ncbi:MAG: OmpA family protein [Bacteroidota bacterium]
MRVKWLLIQLIFTFWGINLSVSQSDTPFEKDFFKNDKEGFKNAMDNLYDGDDYYRDSSYALALGYFLKANSFNPNSSELNYKIGICYLNSINSSKALDFLTKSYELSKQPPKEVRFHIAIAHQSRLEFEKAIEIYNEFKISLSPNDLYDWHPILQKKFVECETGINLLANPTGGMIINVQSVNSDYPEYCPLITADESMMIFTSRRDNTTGGQRDPVTMQFYEDIYVSYNENDAWSEPISIGSPINTDNHDATVGLSPDGQELYIYRGEKKKNDIIPGDLYVSSLKGDEWSVPRKLSENINTNYGESSASISFDGRTLYFVSNRPGGIGGRDIYYSTREPDKEWRQSINMGNVINSIYDEEGVFAHPDGKTIYFSSRGHETMGGYDIFKSVMDEKGIWSKPENLGFPINTADDDVYFILSADGRHGYFSSVKPGGKGEKDIYLINFTDEENVDKSIYLTLVKGKIIDATTNKAIEAKIEITDNEKNEVVAVFESNSSTGDYLVTLPSGKNYGIAASAEGYLFHSENFNLPSDKEYDKVILNISLNSMNEGSTIILKNLFFDYAKSELKSESINELNRVIKMLQDNSTMRIEIGGHTDNQSSLATNQKLSTDRAKSVVDYLISNGIDKNRLEYKGYAFYQPIADNDTEEGKAKNRRVEFKILRK